MSGAFREAVQINSIIAVTCEQVRQLLSCARELLLWKNKSLLSHQTQKILSET